MDFFYCLRQECHVESSQTSPRGAQFFFFPPALNLQDNLQDIIKKILSREYNVKDNCCSCSYRNHAWQRRTARYAPPTIASLRMASGIARTFSTMRPLPAPAATMNRGFRWENKLEKRNYN